MKIKIIGDSQLIINKFLGTYQYHNEILKKYKLIFDKIILQFDKYIIESSLRSTNRFADTIATLGSLILSQDNKDQLTIHITTLHDPYYIISPIINQNEVYNANPWYTLMKYFLKLGISPHDMTKMKK